MRGRDWPRARRRGLLGSALLAVVVTLLAGAGAAGAASSPGFRPDPGLSRAKAQPLPLITLGTGKYPNLIVDPAGTAHVVYAHDGGASAADTYLRVQSPARDSRAARRSPTVPRPQVPPDSSQGGISRGNFPAVNHDFDGPVPLDDQQPAARDRPPVPRTSSPRPRGQPSDSNVFEWSSSDGGATLTGPGRRSATTRWPGGRSPTAIPAPRRSARSAAPRPAARSSRGPLPAPTPGPPRRSWNRRSGLRRELASDLSGPVLRPIDVSPT